MKHIGVFSYPDIPGFVAALKGNAIGNVWSFSGYKNSDESNCAYIDIAFKNNTYDEIYFLLASELTKDLKHCLGHYVQLNQKVPSIEMGSFYSERNRKNYNLKLLGPYSSIK